MQFIPSTWRTWQTDGDGDGVADPNDIDDAALAAAGYLCQSGDLIGRRHLVTLDLQLQPLGRLRARRLRGGRRVRRSDGLTPRPVLRQDGERGDIPLRRSQVLPALPCQHDL